MPQESEGWREIFAARGILPGGGSFVGGERYSSPRFPRSASPAEVAVDGARHLMRVDGPFGPIITLVVTNLSNVDALISTEDTVDEPIYVPSGSVRRLEFFTPNNEDGVRIDSLDVYAISIGVGVGAIRVEVE